MSTLRRTLGETRTKERAAREEAEAARSRAEETAARLERELRQLRAQVAKLEEQAGEQRRQTRSDRDEVTVRARLLLETINDAAVGLRRELGLPNVSGNPGDRVEAPLADEGTREPTSTGSMAPGSPALLEQYLALPRSRLIIDGYNVTKSDLADPQPRGAAGPAARPAARAGRAHQRRGHGGLRRGGLRDPAGRGAHRVGSRCSSAPSASSPTT